MVEDKRTHRGDNPKVIDPYAEVKQAEEDRKSRERAEYERRMDENRVWQNQMLFWTAFNLLTNMIIILTISYGS